MYNMWSQQLLAYLKLKQYGISLRDISAKELEKMMREAIQETILQYAWELAVTHNLSLGEAEYIVLTQLANAYGGS